MNIALLYYGNPDGTNDYWNVPIGLRIAFTKLGHLVDEYKFDPKDCHLDKLVPRIESYDFIIISWPWTSPSLDSEIQRLKTLSKTPIVLELGDEPQTFGQALERIKYVDAAYTQDLRCQKKYIEMGHNVYWLTHWGDEFLFYYNDKVERTNKCITTCGKRSGTDYIQSQLGDKFVNKRITAEENNAFYNSGTIAFQYANNDEITRRIMEAGGCKLAVVTNRISSATGIYDLFIDGKDIFYYSSSQEAVDKIKLLLNNDTLRNTMAENMYNKINLFHRAETRCKQIINIINALPVKL